jgi:hypothetical protein
MTPPPSSAFDWLSPKRPRLLFAASWFAWIEFFKNGALKMDLVIALDDATFGS